VVGSVMFLLLSSFRSNLDGSNFPWIESCFKAHFDPAQKLKKWELSVNKQGFFRFRKFHLTGKQEYFSLNLARVKDFQYWGTVDAGEIIVQTKGEDVIVQTYNDPKGNVDSMSNCVKIPVINIEPELLDSLRVNLVRKSE